MRFRLALLALGMASWGYAQTLVAEIPFHFRIGDQNYEAGRYTFSASVSSADSSSVWAMRPSGAQKTIMFQTISGNLPARTPADPRLVFHKYGKTHFLSEVWAEGRPGRQLLASGGERELAKNPASGEIVMVKLVHQ